MTQATEQVRFWNYLLELAETLEATPDANAQQALQEQLSTVHEAFGECADPVDHYEAYVALKLCSAIERVLQRQTR